MSLVVDICFAEYEYAIFVDSILDLGDDGVWNRLCPVDPLNLGNEGWM